MVYKDLVEYIKENHVDWNTDLFDVLKNFFNSKFQKLSNSPHTSPPIQQELLFSEEEFHEPENGEYTQQDLFNLFNS